MISAWHKISHKSIHPLTLLLNKITIWPNCLQSQKWVHGQYADFQLHLYKNVNYWAEEQSWRIFSQEPLSQPLPQKGWKIYFPANISPNEPPLERVRICLSFNLGSFFTRLLIRKEAPHISPQLPLFSPFPLSPLFRLSLYSNLGFAFIELIMLASVRISIISQVF